MRRLISLTYILAIVALYARAITPQEAVTRFATANSMKHASVGVMFMDIETGNVIASHNPDLSIVTASTMKTITSVSALEALGGQYRFTTTVETRGSMRGDTLVGNIVIKGYGDPTLGTQFIKGVASLPSEIAQALSKQGIKAIDGAIITDCSYYPTPYYNDWWDVGDLAQDYGAGVFPINYRDNTVRFNFNVDKKGCIQDAHFVPEVPGATIIDRTCQGRTNYINTTLDYGTHALVLMGETAAGKGKSRHSWIVANPTPEALLVADVEKAIKGAGITITNNQSPKPAKWEKVSLVDHKSPELTEIVTSLLDRSDNMFTHALLKKVGAQKSTSGNVDGTGTSEVKRILRSLGVNTDALFMRDGSGLARVNRASVRLFCNMLRAVANKKYNNKRLTDLMPRAGKRIGSILPTTSLSKDISLKSGSMSDVQCFVGYYPAENPTIAWAVLVNNYTCERSTLKNNIDRMFVDVLLNK